MKTTVETESVKETPFMLCKHTGSIFIVTSNKLDFKYVCVHAKADDTFGCIYHEINNLVPFYGKITMETE